MAVERTLTIIKPDAVAKNVAGQIIARFEQAGLKILAAKLVHLSPAQAAGFYIVHKDRPFYGSLCAFMTQGPCLPMVLEGEGAIARLRDLMGATDPTKAATGTIRKDFASSIEANAVHGSDSPQTAAFEIAYFFGTLEIQARWTGAATFLGGRWRCQLVRSGSLGERVQDVDRPPHIESLSKPARTPRPRVDAKAL